MGEKINGKAFVKENFDYLNILYNVSENQRCNPYLMEYIANGFAVYGKSPEAFVEHVDDWLRSLVNVYKEITFDYKTNQVKATIDLIDQLVLIDNNLVTELDYIISVQQKNGLMVKFTKRSTKESKTTTLSRYYEYIQTKYPKPVDRYKGLGSSPAPVSRDTFIHPSTRRIRRVNVSDVERMIEKAGILIGGGKENINKRKDLLLSFRFNKEDIDN